MFDMLQLLAETNLLLLAFSVFVFDIPRYTLSLISLALFGVRKRVRPHHLGEIAMTKGWSLSVRSSELTLASVCVGSMPMVGS